MRAPAIGYGPVSRARAELMCRALARLAGGDVPRTAVGRGTAHPIVSNATERGRATNRRVVVTVRHRRLG